MIYLFLLLLSIWHSFMFYEQGLGINVLLFIIPLIILFVYYNKKENVFKNKKYLYLSISIILLSSSYGLFQTDILYVLNLLIIPCLFIIMFIFGIKDESFKTLKYFFFNMIFDPLSHIKETLNDCLDSILTKLNLKGETKNKVNQYIRGIVVVIPVVLLVLFLLSSADMEFGKLFEKLFDFILSLNFFGRLIRIAIIFVYLGSFLFYIKKYFKSAEIIEFNYGNNDNKTYINDFSINLGLTILNIIYLLFSYIQIKSLLLHNVGINVSYAEYARTGFFQLLFVSIINVVVIYIANRDKFKSVKYINIMSTIMVLFTYVILASSFIRMHYYEGAYGYTVLRFLVFVALFAEALLLIPLVIYIFNNKVNIIKIYCVSILGIYILINFINVGGIVASLNVERYKKTGKVDVIYIESLSSAGAPALDKLYKITKDPMIKKEIRNYFSYVRYENNFQDSNLSDYIALNITKKYPKEEN